MRTSAPCTTHFDHIIIRELFVWRLRTHLNLPGLDAGTDEANSLQACLPHLGKIVRCIDKDKRKDNDKQEWKLIYKSLLRCILNLTDWIA